MVHHRYWIGCLLAGCIGAAHAGKADLFGVAFELPFEHSVRKIEDHRGGGGTISVRQWYHVDVPDPAGGTPREAMLGVIYLAPQGASNSAIQEAFDENASEASSKPGTRDTARFDIDDFSFHFIDGPLEHGDYPQRMSIGGVVNGAVLRLSVLAHDASLLTPELAERLKATTLKYAELLRAKADFEAESRLAVRDNALDTPLSRIELGRTVQARLAGSYLQTDGEGRPLYRSRTFGLFKSGFWTLQGLSLSVGCGERAAFDQEGPEGFLTMEARLRDEDGDRPVNLSPPQPSTLAGLEARLITAKGGKVNPMRRTDISRWLAETDGNVYQVEIERLNGSPVEKELIRQLQSADPMCQLGLQFGARSGT